MNTATTPARARSGPTETARTGHALTYAGAAPADLIGRTVNVRPYYHRPIGHGSAISQLAEQCHTGCVVEVFGSEMVVVAFAPGAPGNARQAFYPGELHDPDACACRACIQPATADADAQSRTDLGRAQAAATRRHTCNDGHGPHFGRLTDGCPRCEELKAGAEPVRWHRAQQYPYQPHTCTDRCMPVCTANDW